jgi:hypothetical protein
MAKSSPKNSKRGCLCKDGKTYSKECCEGELINQGIGKTQSDAENPTEMTVTENPDGSRVIVIN